MKSCEVAGHAQRGLSRPLPRRHQQRQPPGLWRELQTRQAKQASMAVVQGFHGDFRAPLRRCGTFQAEKDIVPVEGMSQAFSLEPAMPALGHRSG